MADSEVQPVWTYTMRAQCEALASPYGAAGGGPYGSYGGRHIIGRDSRIFGGIDIVAGHPDESIVVSHDEPDLPEVYAELIRCLAQEHPQRTVDVLHIVHALVKKNVRYRYLARKQLVRKMGAGKERCKLPLALFVRYRVGVCREQALLAGYLIERLIDDRAIAGAVSLDRSMQKLSMIDRFFDLLLYQRLSDYGGHEWARYTSPTHEVWIVDVAQGYCGPLWKNTWLHGWIYARPEDQRPAHLDRRSLFEPFDYWALGAGALALLAWVCYHFL